MSTESRDLLDFLPALSPAPALATGVLLVLLAVVVALQGDGRAAAG
ncbi:hypothetical protein [Streptomyces atratus]